MDRGLSETGEEMRFTEAVPKEATVTYYNFYLGLKEPVPGIPCSLGGCYHMLSIDPTSKEVNNSVRVVHLHWRTVLLFPYTNTVAVA